MTIATSLAILLQLLHWGLFLSTLATVIIYGKLTKWNEHPTGRGLFWTCVGYSSMLLVTSLGRLVTEATMPYYLTIVIILYVFMIVTVNIGMNRQILIERKIGRANDAVKLQMKEEAND